jgi:hypothetical protein
VEMNKIFPDPHFSGNYVFICNICHDSWETEHAEYLVAVKEFHMTQHLDRAERELWV